MNLIINVKLASRIKRGDGMIANKTNIYIKSLDGAGTNENICPLRVRLKPIYRQSSGYIQNWHYHRRMQMRSGDIIHDDY